MTAKTKTVVIRLANVVRRLAAEVGLDEKTVKYVLRRFRAEGLTFLTKTLPKLSKSVLYSLEYGTFQRKLDSTTYLTDFAWKGSSLVYFSSLLALIFDRSGRVLDTAGPAISRLRTFCEYLYKLATDSTDADRAKALRNWKAVDEEVILPDASWIRVLKKNFETYYGGVSKAHVHSILEKCRPRFTSGSFYGSERTTSVRNVPLRTKTELREIASTRPVNWAVYKQLSDDWVGTCPIECRPFSGYFKPYPSAPTKITLKSDKRTTKVLFVPKDSRAPRTISKEPLLKLKAQMSYFDFVSSNLQRLTGGRINFTDQEVNKNLAKQGSIDKSWATLDLKEASDRVGYRLCKEIFANSPGLLWFINHARSTHAEITDSTVIKLKKLAGMGSGLTFPSMALVIHLSICSFVTRKTGIPYREVMDQVYVYGDDVIVPRLWYSHAIRALEKSSLRVNGEKSFHRGFFRESCGGDYFKGVDVTPVRLRLAGADLPTSASLSVYELRTARGGVSLNLESAGILQLERHCRELVLKGFYYLAEYYYGQLEKSLGSLPFVAEKSPVLGRLETDSTRRFSGTYWVPVPVTIKGQTCPYKFISSRLRVSEQSEDWYSYLFPESGKSEYGIIPLPRSIKLVRRVVEAPELY